MTIRFWKGMSLGDFLCQPIPEEWDEFPGEWNEPPLAPPQDFIGPRCFPPKWLRCEICNRWVLIPDKYRRAKRATCFACANALHH